MLRDTRRIGGEHDFGDLGDLERVTLLCGVDLEFAQRHNCRSMEGTRYPMGFGHAELPFEGGCGFARFPT